jgi:hypothetical protein
MHPLIADIDKFKDAELEAKVQELSRKYFMTHNPDVQGQIVMVLEAYKTELAARRAKAWQAEYQKRDKDLDGLINIS